MGFVNGLLLWGALLASIPVIIHLLNRRRFKVVEWAAMEWLLEARIRNRRRVRLENLLLLLLRALLLLILALLLARPFLERGLLPAASALGGTEHVVVLDDSMSMSLRLGDRTPWDRALERLGDAVERLRSSSPGSRITVLRASRPDAPEIDALPVASRAVDDLRERLAEEGPSALRLRAARALTAVLDRGGEGAEAGRRSILVISDLRRTDWLDEEDLPAAVARLIERGWPLRILDVGAGEAANLSVTELSTESRWAVAGVPVRLRVGIVNRGPVPIEGVRLAVRTGDLTPPPVGVGRLEPGRAASVPVDIVFPSAGHHAVSVRLDEDRLPGDDARHLALEVRESTRALVVAGDPFPITGEGEGDFLRTALSPAGGALSGVDVEVAGEGRLHDVDLEECDLVVLAGITSPPPEAVERLEAWVEAGGGLVIFGGERTDPDAMNRLLWRDGEGLLPAALGDPQGDPARPGAAGLEVALPDHPLVRGFEGAGNPLGELLRRVRVFRRSTIRTGTLADEAQVVLVYDESEGGEPALIERTRGRGRVVLVTTSADRTWTSWPRNPTYLVLLQEILRRVGRPGEADLTIEAGARIRRLLDASRTDGRVVVRSPAWPDEAEREHRAGAHPEIPDRLVLDAGVARLPGVHELRVSLRSGEEETVAYAVNVHPDEGDLRRAEEEEIETRLPGAEVEAGAEAEAIAPGEGRAELAPILALLLAGIVLLESFVAWVFGHHGRREAEAAGGAS